MTNIKYQLGIFTVFVFSLSLASAADLKKYLDISGIGARNSASDVATMCSCAMEFESEAEAEAPYIEKIYLPIRLKILNLEVEKKSILEESPELAEFSQTPQENSPYQILLHNKRKLQMQQQSLAKLDEFLGLLLTSKKFPKDMLGHLAFILFRTKDSAEENFESAVMAYLTFIRLMPGEEAKIILTKLFELSGLRIQDATTLNPYFVRLESALVAYTKNNSAELQSLQLDVNTAVTKLHDEEEALESQLEELSENSGKKSGADLAAFALEKKLGFLRDYDELHAQLTTHESIFRQALKKRYIQIGLSISKKFNMPGAAGPYTRVGFTEPIDAQLRALDKKAQKILAQ